MKETALEIRADRGTESSLQMNHMKDAFKFYCLEEEPGKTKKEGKLE